MTKDKNREIPDSVPSRADILKFVEKADGTVKKNDVAKYFRVSGDDRIGLKDRLRNMITDDQLAAGPDQTLILPQKLPTVVMAKVLTMDDDSFLIARPITKDDDNDKPGKRSSRSKEEIDIDGTAPPILILPSEADRAGLEVGEKALLRVREITGGSYEGSVIKRFAKSNDETHYGFIREKRDFAVFESVDRDFKKNPRISKDNLNGAGDGDFVKLRTPDQGANEVVEKMGHEDDPHIVSLIAIQHNDIPMEFPEDVLAETKHMTVPPLNNRDDMRDIPLITIDGADARDFDDAVWAEPDSDPNNKGGFKIIVAIADVAHYVRPGTALNEEAFKRGNSTYFPDRVVPMLPDKLSNDLCSLRPDEPRACMALKMTIDHQGQLKNTDVMRGLMKSHARLTYDEAQAAIDGDITDNAKPVLNSTLKPLFQAYQLLLKARERRGTVDFDFPERKIKIENGRVSEVEAAERHDTHKLIEEMMILANVAVSEVLQEAGQPLIYRIHDQPDTERLENNKKALRQFGLKMGKTSKGVKPEEFDRILTEAKGRDEAPLVQQLLLRTMAQAVYHPENIGHFGLSLDSYAHYTSPIRRYADLIVHRALVSAFDLDSDGSDALTDSERNNLAQIAEHISTTERRSMLAEREASDRYLALFMDDKVGQTFEGRISGITNFGMFIRLDDTGADGMVPLRSLDDDYYVFDEEKQQLVGRRTKKTYRLCLPVKVKLVECKPLAGQMRFDIVSAETVRAPKKSGGKKGGNKKGHNRSTHKNRGQKNKKRHSRSKKSDKKQPAVKSTEAKPPQKAHKKKVPQKKSTPKGIKNKREWGSH